jgi:hypothetical protein
MSKNDKENVKPDEKKFDVEEFCSGGIVILDEIRLMGVDFNSEKKIIFVL